MLNFVRCFFCICWDHHVIFFFILFMSLIDLWMLNLVSLEYITVDHGVSILLMCCWIWLAKIFFFADFCIYVHQEYWPVAFFSFWGVCIFLCWYPFCLFIYFKLLILYLGIADNKYKSFRWTSKGLNPSYVSRFSFLVVSFGNRGNGGLVTWVWKYPSLFFLGENPPGALCSVSVYTGCF